MIITRTFRKLRGGKQNRFRPASPFHERSENCEMAMGMRAASSMMAGLTTAGTDTSDLIPGPKLRAKLGISAVTLWRWRHDPDAGFPAPKLINGGLYFPSDAVAACRVRWRVVAGQGRGAGIRLLRG